MSSELQVHLVLLYLEMLIPSVNEMPFFMHGFVGFKFGGDGKHAILQFVRNRS